MSNKKGKRRKFSVAEMVQWHQNRMKSLNATENQKAYSRHWLDGYGDEHARDNLIATERELKERKEFVAQREKEIENQKSELRTIKSVNKTVFGGFINGAKAKLKRK